jgi:hypothetical protein
VQADASPLVCLRLKRALECAGRLQAAVHNKDQVQALAAVAAWEQHIGVPEGEAKSLGRGAALDRALAWLTANS